MVGKQNKMNPNRQVGATTHACKILKVLSKRNGARVSDIAEEVGLSKGAVHTQLSTLLSNEFVVQRGFEYYPSLLFLRISEDLKRNSPIYEAGKGELKRLAEQEDARVQIVVEEFGMAVALHMESGPNAVASTIQPGNRDHMHTNAAGKAMLAFMAEERVEEILDQHGLPARTENTITNRDELTEELNKIRETGYAFNRQENVEGLTAVGAPVLDGEGYVCAGISLSLPAKGLDEQKFKTDLSGKVLNLANRIEINLNMKTF